MNPLFYAEPSQVSSNLFYKAEIREPYTHISYKCCWNHTKTMDYSGNTCLHQKSLIYTYFPKYPHCVTISSLQGCLLEQNTCCLINPTVVLRTVLSAVLKGKHIFGCTRHSSFSSIPFNSVQVAFSPSETSTLPHTRYQSVQQAACFGLPPVCVCSWLAAGTWRMWRVHFTSLDIALLVSCVALTRDSWQSFMPSVKIWLRSERNEGKQVVAYCGIG